MPRTRDRSLAVLAAIALAVPGLGAGCGPSLRMLHESTVYFERCHAAELIDDVPIEFKVECWERWVRWYSASQASTRVIYARERLVYLAQGELVDPLPVGSIAAAETAPEFTESGTLGGDSGAVRVAPDPHRPLTPRQTGSPVCDPVCRPGWDACSTRCDPNDRACRSACQTTYGTCMSGCL